ncbi:hypothetical protein [Telmatospirillum siberiense]|uniref:Ankyrin repeat domain-containing protein n=1 Tax=Telmatospirillum siberiense TaxID=382514 RepID=A0A2N3PTA0_9PROT|nr:hypothetical protein [Telmatospirillum siberiense]PKU23630.1 hypothetical protein CWS72_15230 [Telmatospirillum siberiense]
MRTVADIHEDITARQAKVSGKFGYFFVQWIKFRDHSDRLYEARGENGETYLQFRLMQNHVVESAAIFETVLTHWKETDQEARIFNFLNSEDTNGNGIWHYLADTLREHEGVSTLKIARTLLAMDIDFSRRNRLGISPLSKMLLPAPRWQSLNALIQTKHLSIENIEGAINERSKDQAQRNHLMTMIFTSDIEDNRGLLSQHVLHQAVQPQADITLRAATCRLFFEYVDVEQGGTAFFKLISIANHAMFDDLMRLLIHNTAETVNSMGAPDVATRKSYGQAYLAKKLLRRDKRGENVLFKALFAGKHNHMRKISSLLHNDNLAMRTTFRGETVRKDLVVDKASPAPCNPLLSLLLQQDVEGNTVLHHTILRNDVQALKWLFSGLAPNDMYAIIKSFPNRYGLTLLGMVQPEIVKAKLGHAMAAKAISPQRAKEIFVALNGADQDLKDYLDARLKEIDELATLVGRKEPLPPSFQLPRNAPASN